MPVSRYEIGTDIILCNADRGHDHDDNDRHGHNNHHQHIKRNRNLCGNDNYLIQTINKKYKYQVKFVVVC